MTGKPKVSILCLTYNQVNFVKQTLDGFMMQETNFKFEVLINDDASNDGTQEIIKQYQEKYPDVIKPIFQKENQYSKGYRGMLSQNLLPIAKGEYLALCEGDDYWTDPDKLQLQVDFLDKHPDYAICFHKVKVVYENGEKPDAVYPDVPEASWYSIDQLLRANYIQTNSVMYRKQKYAELQTNIMPGDWYLHLYHAQFGRIKLIDRVMSVYRKHAGGVWWNYDVDRDKIWKQHGLQYMRLLVEQLRMFGDVPKRREIIENSIQETIDTLIGVDDTHHELLDKLFAAFPEVFKVYTVAQYQRMLEHTEKIKQLEARVAELHDAYYQESAKLTKTQAELDAKTKELQEIHNSTVWRMKQKSDVVRSKLRRQADDK